MKLSLPKITPFLWFDDQALEAAEFYISVFPNSKIIWISPMIVEFELDGQNFNALNGGPRFKFNESISFVINCEDQKEVDHYWDKLIERGGEHSMCGWLKDRFGLSWQVVPNILLEKSKTGESQKIKKMMDAMLKMRKLAVQDLMDAYNA